MKKQNKISLIIDHAYLAFSGYRRSIAYLFIFGIISGLLEGIGVNAIIPLFSLITNNGNMGDDVISRNIVTFFSFFRLPLTVYYMLGLIIILFLLKAVFLFWSNYIKIKITAEYEETKRLLLLERTLHSTWAYLIRQKIGYLENVIMHDIQRSGLLLQQITSFVMVITGLFVYLLVAINISFIMTFITMVVGAIFFTCIRPVIIKTRDISRKTVNLNKKIAHLINEQIVGLKTLKTMAVEKNVYNIASLHFADLKSYKISRFLLNSVVTIMMQPFSLLFISGLFIFTLKTSYFSFSAMIALVYLIQRIFVYIQQLQTTWQGINETFPHLEYVNNYLMESKKNQEKKMGNDTFSFKKDIVFNNVSFSYAYSDKKILNSLNFTLRCGEMLGIVGPSGAGKTTFVDVLLRLHEPQEGTIFIDGLPLSGISLHSWRKNIGYVSQDYFLINDSFLNNIKYYDESISREDAIEAAKMANIYDFIESSANGFDTLIGDRGLMLSNGQRQRIVIARILARKPKLLVFDEATSSLDKESEKKIQQVIENIRGKITIIIIAHRLSTIHHCNTLLVLNDGGVVESGSPDILLSDTSSYFYKVSNLGL